MSIPVYGPIGREAMTNDGPLADMIRKIQQDFDKAGKDFLLELWKIEEQIKKDQKKQKPF